MADNYAEIYLKKLRQNASRKTIEDSLDTLIITHSEIIVQKVRDRWKGGKGVRGGIIGTYKSQAYELFKQRINPLAGGNVDLMNTGRLSKGLALKKAGKGGYFIFSTDSKYDKIGKKYGFEEFGLTDAEGQEVIRELLSEVVQQIESKLFN